MSVTHAVEIHPRICYLPVFDDFRHDKQVKFLPHSASYDFQVLETRVKYFDQATMERSQGEIGKQITHARTDQVYVLLVSFNKWQSKLYGQIQYHAIKKGLRVIPVKDDQDIIRFIQHLRKQPTDCMGKLTIQPILPNGNQDIKVLETTQHLFPQEPQAATKALTTFRSLSKIFYATPKELQVAVGTCAATEFSKLWHQPIGK